MLDASRQGAYSVPSVRRLWGGGMPRGGGWGDCAGLCRATTEAGEAPSEGTALLRVRVMVSVASAVSGWREARSVAKRNENRKEHASEASMPRGFVFCSLIAAVLSGDCPRP